MCGRYNVTDSPEVRQLLEVLELQDSAIAFGGVCQHYLHQETGESVYAASIITLPSLAQWQHIHPKSMPLILPLADTALLDAWLDPQQTDTAGFAPLLEPAIRQTQKVTRIGRPSKWNASGAAFLIETETRNRIETGKGLSG
jgi:putative SOS response-associated peptidase YedK